MSKLSRRQFLAAAGIGGTGAALAAIAGNDPLVTETPPAQQPRKPRGYRVSEHVRKYYRTARV
jgi:hypothetical protein